MFSALSGFIFIFPSPWELGRQRRALCQKYHIDVDLNNKLAEMSCSGVLQASLPPQAFLSRGSLLGGRVPSF
ncbi:hypothetical protein AOXY_G26085 [Acipenser oxyrinchus oxyrinchus]|uniref:Uncharacterized protein n=1 Tax=Acipenser oxyrinchus oxyrinchus TaxID=40147 RepID=A0AAD8CSG7_ACIOX|nr:hypothetical protein AOXY_G26085 [Acipenser oxyrinchus oxyrinchus]